jgi:transposase
MVLDRNGNPVCSELWPGNTADVKSLVPIVERLKSRFGIGSVCIVADRGMISAETLAEVEKREWQYILGVRMAGQRGTDLRVCSPFVEIGGRPVAFRIYNLIR